MAFQSIQSAQSTEPSQPLNSVQLDVAHTQLAQNTFKKFRLQKTFDLIAQGLIVGFVGILIWYNWLMFSPHLTPLLFAMLFVVLLYKPLLLVQRGITFIDTRISDFKLKIYLTFAAIYLIMLVTGTLITIIISSSFFAVLTFLLFGDRRAVSAIVLLTVLCLALGLPSYYTIVTCVNESTELAVRIQEFVQENPEFQTLLDDFGHSTHYLWLQNKAKQWGLELPHYDAQLIKDKIVEFSMNFTSLFTNALGSFLGVLSSGVQIFVHLLTFFSSLYYFLIHFDSILTILPDLSPFSDEDSAILMKSLHSSVVQIFLSSFLIFITHLTGSYIIFSLTHIELTLVLSVLAGFTSVLPILGSYVVWIPIVVVKLIMGQNLHALVITIVQLVLQFPVDLAIYSIIPGNAFLVAFSLTMGMYIFGMLGIVLGPLLAGILVTVMNMYATYQQLPRLKLKNTEVEIDLTQPTPTLSLSMTPSNRSAVRPLSGFSGMSPPLQEYPFSSQSSSNDLSAPLLKTSTSSQVDIKDKVISPIDSIE